MTFYGAFLRDSAVVLALEFMDGGSLENVIHQLGSIPERVLGSVAFQVLFALSYLKTNKRVHRDIKPPNILLNARGEVKLSDFGIATELCNSIGRDASRTVACYTCLWLARPLTRCLYTLANTFVANAGGTAMCGTFVGTFRYMSPERIQRAPYSYSSDIWSLGLVLMEAATGVYPYPKHRTCIEVPAAANCG